MLRSLAFLQPWLIPAWKAICNGQSEVKTNLATIHAAEKLYHASNGSYTDDHVVLGVDIADDAIYSYGITATASTFTATATANLDDDATEDTWTINQDKQLVQTTDDLAD